MDEAETECIRQLPEAVRIFRGDRDEQHPFWLWTLNEGVAHWFAVWHAKREHKTPTVYEASISKGDIIGFIDDSDEEEIIINPSTILNVKILPDDQQVGDEWKIEVTKVCFGTFYLAPKWRAEIRR